MNRTWIRNALYLGALTSALILVAWPVERDHRNVLCSIEELNWRSRWLTHIAQRDVLDSQYAPLANTGRLTLFSGDLLRVAAKLQTCSKQLDAAGLEPISLPVRQAKTDLEQLATGLQRLASINAGYRNSLAYLINTAHNSASLALQREDYSLIALFNRAEEAAERNRYGSECEASDHYNLAHIADDLQAAAASANPDYELAPLAAHARKVSQLNDEIFGLVDSLVKPQHTSTLELVTERVDAAMSQAAETAEVRIWALLTVALSLAAFVVVVLLQLYRTGRRLALVNDSLEARVIERTAELEEQGRRLAQAQKLESIGQLAAGIAHEINTPMQCVSGNIEYLKASCARLLSVTEAYRETLEGPSMSWEVRRDRIAEILTTSRFSQLEVQIPAALDESNGAALRVIEIVRAMKAMSHPGTRERVSTDINVIIRNAVAVSRNRWKYAAQVTLDLAENLPDVKALPAELSQVILNMIINAADAIAEKLGESSPTLGAITVRTRSAKDHIRIEIEDSGCGMSAEIRDRVFDLFFTTKDVGKGTGQGLAISHEVIVKQHGGTIDIASTPGAGTTFVICLPLSNGSHPSLATVPEARLAVC